MTFNDFDVDCGTVVPGTILVIQANFLSIAASLEPADDAAQRAGLPQQPHRVEPQGQSTRRQIYQTDGQSGKSLILLRNGWS